MASISGLPILFSILVICSGEELTPVHNFQEVLKNYQLIGNSVTRFLSKQILGSTVNPSKLLLEYERSSAWPNVSGSCMNDIVSIGGQIDPDHLPPPQWVLRFLDAQAKPPNSIMEGNIVWLGGFHECMNLTVFQNDSNPTPDSLILQGQYCLATIGLNNEDKKTSKVPLLSIPRALRLGLCVPSTCSAYDVEQLLTFAIGLLEGKYPHIQENVTISEVRCQAKKIPMDGTGIAVIVAIVFVVTIVLIGSFYDVLTSGTISSGHFAEDPDAKYSSSYTSLLPEDRVAAAEEEAGIKEEPRSIVGQVCMAVSILPHCQRVFCVVYGKDELRWVHGIRVLSMMWIIFGQTYALGLPLYDNLLMLPEAMKGLFAQLIVQATFAVDTFLFLSGYLVTFRVLNNLSRGFDCWILIRFYISRYLRLFPVYMIVLGIYATLTKYISSGPLWPQDEVMLGNCSHLAWSNAFYINNYIHPEQMCMPWTWYIAIDFQLFIFAPLIILCLFVFRKIGLMVCAVCICAVAICSGVVSKLRELPPSLVGFGSTDASAFDEELITRYFTEYLITTYCRAAPYFFGIVVAHYLHKPNEVLKLGLLGRVIGWILALIGIVVVLFSLVAGFNGYPVTVDGAAAFNSLSHIIWSAAMSWIAYSCVTGGHGLAEKFLGWRFWMPFSTISYSTYLISPIMICVYYLSREDPIRFSHYNAINLFCGNLLFSLLAGLTLFLFIEAPIRSLSKLILSPKHVKTNIVSI